MAELKAPPTHLLEALLVRILPLAGCVILDEMLSSLGPSLLSVGWILNLGPLLPVFGGELM